MNFNFLKKDIIVEDDSAAVISSQKILTYKELNIQINYSAEILSAIYKVSEGDHIAIISDNTPEFIVLICAIWKLNAVPIPLNTRLLDNELENLIQHSQSKHVFIHINQNERLMDIENRILFPFNKQNSTEEFNLKEGENNLCSLIMYTSGSTGIPKGVVLTRSNIVHSAVTTINLVNQTANDRWLASLPFYHIGGFQIITRTLLKGSTVILPESLDTDNIIKTLYNYKPTMASFVTTTLRRFVELKVKPNPEMHYIFLGGGPIDNELIQKAQELGWNIIKVYGSTETSSMITALKCRENKEKILSAGKAFIHGTVQIIDDLGNVLPPYSKGEIIVSGNSIMRDYWNNDDETSKKIKNGFYYTGDIGYVDEEDFLYVESRRTDLIISGGENINPIEVESELLKNEAIKDVCVFPLTDNEWGQKVAAAIVLNNQSYITDDSIKEYLKGKISSFKIPKKYFFVKTLPRNELGKINREEIRKTIEKLSQFSL